MENKSVEGINAETFLKEKIKYGGWTKLNKLPFSLYEAVAIIMQEYTAQAVGDKQREIDGLKKENDWMKSMLAKTIKR